MNLEKIMNSTEAVVVIIDALAPSASHVLLWQPEAGPDPGGRKKRLRQIKKND
jgi:hypothetical protein